MPQGHMIANVSLTHQSAAYADGDSFGAKRAVSIPVAAGVAIRGLKLVAVRVIDRDGNAPDLDLHLFNEPPANLTTVLTENSTVTFADADMVAGNYLGFVAVAAADYVTGAGASVANKELTNPIRLNAGYARQITVVPVIRNAETFTETTAVDLEFVFETIE